jgi:hypothetical protein
MCVRAAGKQTKGAWTIQRSGLVVGGHSAEWLVGTLCTRLTWRVSRCSRSVVAIKLTFEDNTGIDIGV